MNENTWTPLYGWATPTGWLNTGACDDTIAWLRGYLELIELGYDLPSMTDTTYRERREAKADRLREWADKRDTKAETAHDAAQRTADMIPFGQPIMVGHYSESGDRNRRARMRTNYDKSLEHSSKAAEFRRRADGIERAARNAVYSDDTDAIERLEVRIADREAERDRIKRFNASARKGSPDMSILNEQEVEKILSIAKVASYQLGKGGGFPGYHLTNLGATIRKDKQRLEALTSARGQGGDEV